MKARFELFCALAHRHLLVFFRNKVRLMYTLLVPVVIFAVYLIFLRGLELGMAENILIRYGVSPAAEGYGELLRRVAALVDGWMLSGIIGLSTVTVALQTNTVLVEDKERGVHRDFAASPIPAGVLAASYFFYNFIVTVLVCLVFFAVCLVYLAATGCALPLADAALALAVLFFATVVSTLMTVFLCSFIRTEGTMMGVVALFSTAVGFLIGAYMPLGMLPVWVQGVCAFLPATYACSLLRYAFLRRSVLRLTSFAAGLGLPAEDLSAMLGILEGNFGYGMNFFGIAVSPPFQALALALFLLLFLLLDLVRTKPAKPRMGRGKRQ